MAAETESRHEEVRTRNASSCPVVQALDQVGTPWRVMVVHALADGELRFNELKEETGARSKTLSDALDELVDNDIVSRRMEEAAPVAVYYTLTPKGEELVDALSTLDEWSRQWGATVPDGPNARLRDE